MRTLLVILAAAVFTSGCFYSEDALITRRAADFPVMEGVYDHRPYHPDGRPFDRTTWSGEIEREGWSYASDVDAFPHQNIRLRELSPGIFAAQSVNEDRHYLFGLVWVYPSGLVTYHNPSCSDLSDTARETYGLLEEMTDGYCRIDRWDVLSAVLLTYLSEHDGRPRIDGEYRPNRD